MRRGSIYAAIATSIMCVVMLVTGATARASGATAATWGKAQPITGMQDITSVSCPAAGDCSAGGSRTVTAKGGDIVQAVVLNEKDGRWGRPEVLTIAKRPGLDFASVDQVSCASQGNCGAAGFFQQSSSYTGLFVVGEKNGVWGTAEELPGMSALNAYGDAQTLSLSCPSPGNCADAGYYSDAGDVRHGFVANETSGRWGKAREVLDTTSIYSVSCTSAGNCAGSGDDIVVREVKGAWQHPQRISGLAAVAGISSVSCASAGNCAAGGWETRSDGEPVTAFVLAEKNGTWGKAAVIPGDDGLNRGDQTEVDRVSCTSPGDCAAVGDYQTSSLGQSLFVLSQKNGIWGKAAQLPGIARLAGAGQNATVTGLSCSSAGNCAIAGWYTTASNGSRPFVANEVGGAWGVAEEVPGTAALNTGGSAATGSVSCARSGYCALGGYYTTRSNQELAFVAARP